MCAKKGQISHIADISGSWMADEFGVAALPDDDAARDWFTFQWV
jgi:hypothetical protein